MLRSPLALLVLAALLVTGLATSFPPPAFAQSPCGASVRVGPGDTLYRIASRCGVSMTQILRANPQITNPNTIRLGEILRLAPGTRGYQPQPGPAPRGTTHIVRPGDTLASIARQYGISIAALLEANPQLYDANIIRGGAAISVPGRWTPPRPPAPSPAPTVFTGVLTDEGVACPAMRDDRGRLFTLAGNVGGIRVGDRIEVTGRTAQASICQQGTTINATSVRRLAPPPIPTPELIVQGMLTGEGIECQAMRDRNGRLYTLVGDIGWFADGDFVEVRGRTAQVSYCQQGTTFEVRRIDRVRR